MSSPTVKIRMFEFKTSHHFAFIYIMKLCRENQRVFFCKALLFIKFDKHHSVRAYTFLAPCKSKMLLGCCLNADS